MIINSPVNVLNSKKSKTWQKDGKSSSGILLPDSALSRLIFIVSSSLVSFLAASEKSSGEMAEWSNALVC